MHQDPDQAEDMHVTLPTPIHSVSRAIDTRPTVTSFVVESQAPTHFVVSIVGEGRTVRVPRATPTTPVRDAVRAFLTGGAP